MPWPIRSRAYPCQQNTWSAGGLTFQDQMLPLAWIVDCTVLYLYILVAESLHRQWEAVLAPAPSVIHNFYLFVCHRLSLVLCNFLMCTVYVNPLPPRPSTQWYDFNWPFATGWWTRRFKSINVMIILFRIAWGTVLASSALNDRQGWPESDFTLVGHPYLYYHGVETKLHGWICKYELLCQLFW